MLPDRKRSEFTLSHYGQKRVADMTRDELATALEDMVWRYQLLHAAKLAASLKPIETTVETGQSVLEALFAEPNATQPVGSVIHP